ncbi:MAG TPA: hypothetical protein VFF68_11100 [Anaerolineaceae bacterium]|nr:hypothetical protein [Anaerolineaceae bacterium]
MGASPYDLPERPEPEPGPGQPPEAPPGGEPEESWSEDIPDPTFVSGPVILLILAVGVVGALLAVAAYWLLRWIDRQVDLSELFARSGSLTFLFWIMAGLIIGFALLGLIRLFSFLHFRLYGQRKEDEEGRNINKRA